MNILFLSLSFSTKEHKSFYEDLLREFQNNGHDIYVACANEKKSNEKDGLESINGIKILRIRTGNITGNVSILEKGISTLLIDNLFKNEIAKYWKNIKIDLVIYPTPPITLVNTIEYIKRRTGAKTYLLLKDIFPQNAVDLGMMCKTGIKGLIYRYFRLKEKKLYRISDYIGCMSPANVRYVIQHNNDVEEDKVEVCPNCIKPKELDLKKIERLQIREKYGVPLDKKVFVYGGNLGKPQGIDFFLDCLDAVRDIRDAYFLVVGGGSESSKIAEYINKKGISNAHLVNTLPKQEYQSLCNSCDVGLIFLDYRFTIPNFPSRILSYMQNAMPVLVVTDPSTDMGDIVESNGFGWKCLSNDSGNFKKKVEEILAIDDLASMGRISREFMLDNYDVKDSYRIIIQHFEKNVTL